MNITCRSCDTEKLVEEFPKNKNFPSGLQPYCKWCFKLCRKGLIRLGKRKRIKTGDTPSPKAGGIVCRICFVEKAVGEFPTDTHRKSGIHPYCKDCRNLQKSSPEALAKRRKIKAWATEKARAYHHGYTRRPEVRAKAATHNREYASKFPDKAKAHMAISNGIAQGKIIRPRACQECGKIGRVEAHHYLGYAGEHHFNVRWLCRHCHRAKHRKYLD